MTRFLQNALGIALIIAATGFLIRTMLPVRADVTSPLNPFTTGKYMMDQTVVYSSSENIIYHYILVWDTETGKSKLYWFDRTNKRSFEWEAFGKDLPQQPLP
ncbi:MAG: hypothetical protein N2167_07560 [Flavobacteriales bacterium]|nr:hypothetical protein [Flavobacteriales bacterium]